MRWFALAFTLIACNYTPGSQSPGGDDNTGDDAAAATDGGTDTVVDAPPPLPCGYTEQADLVNDQSVTAETTNLTFSSPTVLCGQLDSGHFDITTSDVDVDGYKLRVNATADVLVHITAPGAEALDAVAVQVLDGSGAPLLAVGRFVGTHGTARINLPAGDYLIGVVAKNSSATAAAIPYRVVIVADNPAARCTKGSAVATYNEANDGGNNTGNDMVLFDNGANQKFLTGSGDNPEPAGVLGTSLQLNGTAANDNPSDSYKDRDTYEISTGATTNQLTVRLNWAATTVDFDFLVLFPNMAVSFGSGLGASFTEDEFDTMAVEPNQKYWIWVGADDASSGLPKPYEVTVCAETFTPL